jgi:hypothetical protein
MSFASGRRFTGMDRTDQTLSADEMVSAAIAGDEPAFAASARSSSTSCAWNPA